MCSASAIRKQLVTCALSAALGLGLVAAQSACAQSPVSSKEAIDIATDAYIYGYSLITTEVTRVQMTNVPGATELKAPMNSFFNVKRYPRGTTEGSPRRTPTRCTP